MTMTIEEAKKMVGTEFIYKYSSAEDTVRAYIKKFDPIVGLTAITLDTKTEIGGWKPTDPFIMEEDGTWCVIGVDIAVHGLQCALDYLSEIKATGMYVTKRSNGGVFLGCAF